MAKKNFIKPRKHESGRLITTKTPYGSTSDMIVADEEVLSKINVAGDMTLLKDDDGYYTTFSERIDNGLSDPRRYCQSLRLVIEQEMQEKLKE